MRLVLALSLGLWLAPFQCASEPDPDRRLEDSPEEALLGLAARFQEAGDEPARRSTLEYLVEHYPSSREAERARAMLAGEPSPPPPG